MADGPKARARFVALLPAWTSLFLASPGIVCEGGSVVGAVLALALWGLAAGRPPGPRPRRELAFEWLAATLGFGLWIWWTAYVWWPGLLAWAAALGVYGTLAGALLRRLAPRVPFPLAVALAWTGAETLRFELLPPFSVGWMRLGHFASDSAWLVGGARGVGVAGITFALAAAGGALAVVVARRKLAPGALGFGLGALAAVALAGLVTAPPATVDGPRLLLVQPAFPQWRKMQEDKARNYEEVRALTLRALADMDPPPDLVAWGETMLGLPLFEDGVADALEAGADVPVWLEGVSPDEVRVAWPRVEDDWVRLRLLGLPRRIGVTLPAGTSFLTGAEVIGVEDGRVVRKNAVVLYAPDGTRSGPAAKRVLVPGAETLFGLEDHALVGRFAGAVAGYLADFTAGERTGVLPLTTRDGRAYGVAATVCFDNAYDHPYFEPLRDGHTVDLHLVVSNEAWYHDSCELDQMVAFSRLLAIETGRAMVRATNSGVTLVLGPDGRELARLAVDGDDREVAGTLAVTVPVPAAGAAAAAPPWVHLAPFGTLLALVAPVFCAFLPARRRTPRNPRHDGG